MLSLAAVVFFTPDIAFAGRIRCPVCDQTFPDDQKICPNDGTNLQLLGKKVGPSNDSGSAGKDSKTEKNNTDKTVDDGKSSEKSGKYIRQDRGGNRKRAEEKEPEASRYSERSERRRRMGEERRSNANAEKRRKEKRQREEFAKQDQEIREKFVTDRQIMIDDQKNRKDEDKLAKEGFDASLQRSLWAQAAPLTSVGIRVGWMGEGTHPGPVTGAEIDFNFVKTEFRVGLSTFLGVRSLENRGDLVLLESVSVGLQLPWRFSPFILGRAGVGIMVSNRFGTDITYLLRSIGVETGVDCRIAPSFVVTPSVGYIGYAINDVHWGSVTMKLSIGF